MAIRRRSSTAVRNRHDVGIEQTDRRPHDMRARRCGRVARSGVVVCGGHNPVYVQGLIRHFRPELEKRMAEYRVAERQRTIAATS